MLAMRFSTLGANVGVNERNKRERPSKLFDQARYLYPVKEVCFSLETSVRNPRTTTTQTQPHMPVTLPTLNPSFPQKRKDGKGVGV